MYVCEENEETFVIFNVKLKTQFGENVYMTGSCAVLGDWDAHCGVKLYTDRKSFPSWSCVVRLPPGRDIEYKYVLKSESGSLIWEDTPSNRKVNPSGMWTLLDDGLFGNLRDPTDSIYLLNNARLESLASTLLVGKQQQQQLQLDLKNFQDELRQITEQLDVSKQTIHCLQRQISILEGVNLRSLTISQLKELASKSRKVSELSNDMLLKKLEDQLELFIASKECVICMENAIDTICLPCSHFVLCSKCCSRLQGNKCPICQLRILRYQKVFTK